MQAVLNQREMDSMVTISRNTRLEIEVQEDGKRFYTCESMQVERGREGTPEI